jgi:hypothetical protein
MTTTRRESSLYPGWGSGTKRYDTVLTCYSFGCVEFAGHETLEHGDKVRLLARRKWLKRQRADNDISNVQRSKGIDR